MRPLAFVLSCAIAGAVAQSPATKATPTLHLPAGSHSVGQVLQLISQVVRKPIQLGEGVELPDERSAPMSGDEVLARPELVALVTVSCALGALSQQDAVGRIRPLMGRGRSGTMAAVGPGLALQGLTCDLVPFLQAIAPTAAATKPDK